MPTDLTPTALGELKRLRSYKNPGDKERFDQLILRHAAALIEAADELDRMRNEIPRLTARIKSITEQLSGAARSKDDYSD